ncbi:MAG: hypothetical protein PHQ42_04595 [Patescibacteria group bacterium]|nr:hypothetical protein [Patescibacteria group bacterium]
MTMIEKVKFKYNQIIRPHIDKDLMVLFRANRELYPFKPYPDDVQLLNALKWLYIANQRLQGRGFPAKFSIGARYGLASSYPETTGYTLCTLLTILRNKPWRDFNYQLVIKLIDNSCKYLLTMQLENGAFTGGRESTKDFGTPSIFDSGQILLGLADLYETANKNQEVDSYFVDRTVLKKAIIDAANFLAGEIEEDGSFKATYTYLKSKRSYYARAAYGLLRAGVVLENEQFIIKAKRKFDYVVKLQKENGWIDYWGFEDDQAVLHTIAYTLRGLVEAAIYFKNDQYALVVERAISFLVSYDKKNFLYPNLFPSHYDCQRKYVNDLCITGLSQMAIVIKKFNFYSAETPPQYEKLFKDIIEATKCFQLRGFSNELLNGVMPASWPIDGKYQPNNLIEWGTKFFMDSLLLSIGVPPQEIKG